MIYMPRRRDVFDDMFDGFFSKPFNAESLMKTDVHKKDGYYYLDVELPGYKKEDVDLEISDGYLYIKANHQMNNEELDSKGELIRQERVFGSSSRSFYVGENIKAEDINAKFEDGILKVVLPSKEQKRIETSQKVEIL